jgi:histidinol-phosphate aminotransferase
MTVERLSRRGFAGVLGAAVGASLVRPSVGDFFAEARPARASREGFIQLSSNENPYRPSPAALEALSRSGPVASRYPDGLEDQVRDAIARQHGVPADRIVLGCGSSDILRMADSAFLGPGKKVVAAEPTFEAVLQYARATRAEPVKVPLTPDFRHDLPKMAAACGSDAGLVYVCNPNNPTGTIVTADELSAFLERVPGATAVLVDEAYHHFVEDPKHRSAIDAIPRHPNLVVARTFSKIYGMAGMRLGYAVASEANASLLRANASWNNVNAAALSIALAELADGDLVPRQRAKLNGTRRWLCARLSKDGRRFIPSEANFLMIHVGRDVGSLIPEFRGKGILVGRKFPSMPDWLRVSIGTPEETESFVAALREIVPAKAAA